MPARRHNNRMAKFVKFWLPVIICMGFIFYVSSIPASKIPPLFPFQDIIFHLFVYSILSLFFARALKNTYGGLAPSKIILLTLIFGVFYGLTDEIHQTFVPYRNASGFDVLIDGIGSLVGSLIYPVRKKFSCGGRLSNGVNR